MRGKCVTLRVGVVTVSRPKQAAGNSFRFRRSWSCDSETPNKSSFDAWFGICEGAKFAALRLVGIQQVGLK